MSQEFYIPALCPGKSRLDFSRPPTLAFHHEAFPVIVCRVPRVQTPEGKAETVPVPWAGPRSRFTLLYERLASEVLLACGSVSAAAELLGLSWDQLHLIMERAVKRGLGRRELEELRQVGMDEKSFAKGRS